MTDAYWATPEHPTGAGVLLVAGSSGRVERERADLLAAAGIITYAIRWFGGAGQRPAPHEVPLETFTSALDELAQRCDRLAMFGTSFGAEATLLTAADDDRLAAVIAVAPTTHVWGGVTEADGWSSHWTRGGRPLPYVEFAADWTPTTDPPAYRELYRESLAAADAATRDAARIPVEEISADVVLIAGGDDQVWSSVEFAREIAARRDRPTTVVTHDGAGHRLVLPGETPATGGDTMARGGTPTADAELGARAWPVVLDAIRGPARR